MYVKEVYNTIFKRNKCQYIVLDIDLKVVGFSQKIDLFYDKELIEQNADIYSIVEEFIGFEDKLKELFEDDTQILEIPFVAKQNDVYVNISVEKARWDVLVVLFEDVSKYVHMYDSSVHDRNEKELLLIDLEKKNQELLKYNEHMAELVKIETDKNMQKDFILMQQSKMASMGDMIANIAHQWKQPLNAISTLNQFLILKYRQKKLDDKWIDKFNNDSSRVIMQMSDTIDDFTNFFKPNKEKKHFIINDSMNYVATLVEATLNLANIELQISEDDSCMAFGYQSELQQVLINIINNAKDALLDNKVENPTITMELSCEDRWCSIKISDNAGGISDNIIEKIFDPYFSTKDDDKGTGIGLYMSRLIIERYMYGSLTVHNDENGACFVAKIEKADMDSDEVFV